MTQTLWSEEPADLDPNGRSGRPGRRPSRRTVAAFSASPAPLAPSFTAEPPDSPSHAAYRRPTAGPVPPPAKPPSEVPASLGWSAPTPAPVPTVAQPSDDTPTAHAEPVPTSRPGDADRHDDPDLEPYGFRPEAAPTAGPDVWSTGPQPGSPEQGPGWWDAGGTDGWFGRRESGGADPWSTGPEVADLTSPGGEPADHPDLVGIDGWSTGPQPGSPSRWQAAPADPAVTDDPLLGHRDRPLAGQSPFDPSVAAADHDPADGTPSTTRPAVVDTPPWLRIRVGSEPLPEDQAPPVRHRPSAIRMIGSAVLTTVVLGAIVAAAGALGGVDPTGTGPAGARPSPSVPADDGRTVAAPRAGRNDAIFELVTGASSVRLRTADIGDDLYRVTTSTDGPAVPQPLVRGGQVLVRLAGADGRAPGTVEVVLNPQVRWQVRLTGVNARHLLDLGAARLASVEVQGSTARLEMNLPPAVGTLLIRVTGANGQVLTRAAPGRPVRVRLRAGADAVTVPGRRTAAAGANTVFIPPDWDYATDRYHLDFVSRVGTLTVEQR